MQKQTNANNGKLSQSSTEAEVSPEFKEFFIDEIKDIYWAEKLLTKTIPKMQKAATSSELVTAFGAHLTVTQQHIERLEEIFELLGETPKAKKCDAMAGIVEEGNSILEETEKGTHLRDVGLILAAQKVEHYEIATYGTLAQLSKSLGNKKICSLLEQTLAEEKEADSLLTGIAEKSINSAAATEEISEELPKRTSRKMATA